jgi:Tat protein secretion system quality control protein TatD with DNase activity
VHPCELKGKDPSVAELLALAEDDNIIAIGETGLDYFHVEKDTADWQRERFRRHIAASNQSGKPMIITLQLTRMHAHRRINLRILPRQRKHIIKVL